MKSVLHKSLSVLLAMGILVSSVPAYAVETETQDAMSVQAEAVMEQTTEEAAPETAEAADEQVQARASGFRPGSSYSEPELVSAEYADGGAKITWKEVRNASEYRVYRRTGDEDWKQLEDVSDTTYTDQSIKLGTVYEYTAAVVKNDEVKSSYDEEGISFCRLAAPELSSASNSADGVKISWKSVKNADGYRVYRKVKGGDWTELKDAEKTSCTDSSAQSGKTYYYTVSALYDGEQSSDYNESGLKATYYAAPELSSAARKDSGVKISWKSVSGASEYRVYRKTGDGEWSKLKDVEATSCTDKTIKNGTVYRYTVRVLKNDKTVSAYDKNGISFCWLSTPKLSSVTNGSGVKLTWKSVSKADGYRVYRKTGDGDWTQIADTESAKYTDKSVTSGKTYTYTVRAMYDGELRSDYDKTGLKIKYYSAPELSSVKNGTTGVKLTWEKVSGAKEYRVYRKSGDGEWSKLKDVEGTSCTDKTVKSGKSYAYTVRVLSGGKTVSGYDSKGLSTQYLGTPELSGAKSTKNGIQVSWKSVSGASEYRVYRKTGDSEWSKLKDVEGTSYTDQDVEACTNYTYTVRAMSSKASGAYDSDGIEARFLSGTTVTLAKGEAGVSVRWEKVDGAKGYYVYRRYEDEGWKKLGKTSELLYADESSFPKSGTYSYTVRAYYGSSLGYYDSDAAPSVEIKLDAAEVNRRLKQVMKTYPDGKNLGSGYSFAGAGQCMGFAREVYYRVFDEVVRWDYAGNPKTSEDKGKFTKVAKTTSLSASKVRSVVKQAQPGDVLQLEGPKAHSMIYLSRDEDGFTVYDANWSGPNQVDIRYVSYGSYASRNSNSLCLLHANNYPGE